MQTSQQPAYGEGAQGGHGASGLTRRDTFTFSKLYQSASTDKSTRCLIHHIVNTLPDMLRSIHRSTALQHLVRMRAGYSGKRGLSLRPRDPSFPDLGGAASDAGQRGDLVRAPLPSKTKMSPAMELLRLPYLSQTCSPPNIPTQKSQKAPHHVCFDFLCCRRGSPAALGSGCQPHRIEALICNSRRSN